ncbi:hypothetical protein CSA80_03120 [Candidatus Saccharibacteria bacterium]|nr:MAG: hypothetical protein CR973_00275 [Candidatus Saccharibacteria bacterium]PID99080.1 MAG: hypothetical protein CSA80_03120 [Candidatus Saccharibacteria bacterium]
MSTECIATPVSDFAPEARSSAAVLEYPYRRPETSYVTDGSEVTLIDGSHANFVRRVDEYLGDRELPLLAERVPIVGYGSNASPYQLARKMSRYGQGMEPYTQVIPNERAVIHGAVIAWHGAPSQNGSVFAELYSGPEAEDRQSEVFLQYLTIEQLGIMHTTEGATYHLVPITATTDAGTMRAFAYVASDSRILYRNGLPLEVAVDGRGADGGVSAEEAVEYMLSIGGESIGIHDPRALAEANTGVLLATKKDRQEKVRAALAAQGASIQFSFPDANDNYVGRAALGSVQASGHTPEILHLAEEHLAKIRPTAQQITDRANQLRQEDPDMTEAEALRRARKTADPAVEIRRRATTEIARRIGAEILDGPVEWSHDGACSVGGVVWRKVKIGDNSYRIEKVT